MSKKESNIKFKKAPQAPRRFKSAYMFFSTEKHKAIRQENGKKLQTTDVAKQVSHAWKNLSSNEREHWYAIYQLAWRQWLVFRILDSHSMHAFLLSTFSGKKWLAVTRPGMKWRKACIQVPGKFQQKIRKLKRTPSK
jgi:hypothetical protein